MMKDEYIPLAEIVEELENGSRPEGGVDNSGDIFSVGGEHLNDFGGFDFSSAKMISHDFYNKMNRGKIKPDDIVIVKDGATTGKTSFVTEQFPHFPCAINEHVFRLAVNQKVADPKYVFYYLYSPKGNKEILDDFRGATVGGISQDFVNKVFISLPPLTEQKRIASLLARADRLRQLRRTAHDLGDALLQSVFLEMFGDPFKHYQEKWKSVPFEEITTRITYGFTNPMSHLSSGIPIITGKNVLDGKIDFENVHYADQKEYDALTLKNKPTKSDILITKDGTIGRCAIVEVDFPICINQSVALVQLNNKVIPKYVFGYLYSASVREFLDKMKKGVALQHLQITEFAQIPIPLPPLKVQEEFAGVVTRVELLRGRMGESERQVEGLFESLLAEAFHA